MIKIEKNITPPHPVKRRKDITNAMAEMQPGDSFTLPTYCDPNSLYIRAQRLGIKISARKQRDGNIRVWRMS